MRTRQRVYGLLAAVSLLSALSAAVVLLRSPSSSTSSPLSSLSSFFSFSDGSHKHSAKDRLISNQKRLWEDFHTAYVANSDVVVRKVSSPHTQLSTEEVDDAKAKWKGFVAAAPQYDPSLFVSPVRSGSRAVSLKRGIVTTGGGYQLGLAYAQLRLLRRLGCTLPVEIFISATRDGEPDKAMTAAFRTYGASLRDLDAIIPLSLPALREGIAPTDKGSKPYLLKQLAMISADCEECLFLDADNVPVRDPTFLFDTPAYQEGGMLLWPDLWHNHRGPASIRAIFDLPSGGDAPLADERTVESGQIVFHKARVWQALLLSTYMQIQTDFFDNLMRNLHFLGGGGDKQTFLIACLALEIDCRVVEYPLGEGGVVVDGTYCGRTMVQRGPDDGGPLFVHSNMDKSKYYESMANSETWTESLRRADDVRTPNNEGSWNVQFLHQPQCGWVVVINSDYDGARLRDLLGFDVERERYDYVRQWVALFPPPPPAQPPQPPQPKADAAPSEV